MKKGEFLTFLIISVIFLSTIQLSSCITAKTYSPDQIAAENPPGLSIDLENCVYLGGPIRAINQYDFDPKMRAVSFYPKRSICIPAGENITALVHYNFSSTTVMYYGFKFVSLPPLEKGCFYILYTDGIAIAGNLSDKNIIFKKLNTKSGKYENVEGAFFIK
jgi:hypothetical protein